MAAAALVWGVWACATVTSNAQTPSATTPTSAGIWGGVYTDAQAKRGEAVANKICAACHGAELIGGEGPTLVGPGFLGDWDSMSLGDIFDRIHTSMPADEPGTVSVQDTSDVIAYILKLNKYPMGEAELSTDMAALAEIKIEGPPPAK